MIMEAFFKGTLSLLVLNLHESFSANQKSAFAAFPKMISLHHYVFTHGSAIQECNLRFPTWGEMWDTKHIPISSMPFFITT